MVRSGTVPVQQKANGSLDSNPAPLTVEAVERQPERSAQRAVMQLIFWAQWGNLPAIVDVYDSRIVDRLSVSKIAGTYDYLRPELLTSQPRIITTRRGGGGDLVSVEFTRVRYPPARESFLMRRRDGAWRVVYDTLLERGIEGSTIVQLEPGDSTPSPYARRRGALAAKRYRDAYALLARAERSAAARP